MARRESFDKVALRTLSGTPFTNAEFYRIIPSTGIGEYVRVRRGKVVEFNREVHDEDRIQEQAIEEASKVTKRDRKSNRLKEQNGMEYRGTVLILGSPVDFYGSEKAWKRFLEFDD